MAHKLHLCIKRAIGQYGKPVANIETAKLAAKHRKMLTHFTKSPKNTGQLLMLQQKSLGTVQRCLRPVQDVVTRWTSTAASWLRTLVLRTFFLAWFTTYDPKGTFESALSASEYSALRGQLAVISPGKMLTEFMQSSRSVTISLSPARVSALASHAKNVRVAPRMDDPTKRESVQHNDLPAAAKETGRVLSEEIGKRFAPETMPLPQAIAEALDPRTKGYAANASSERQRKIYEAISSELAALRTAQGLAPAPAPAPATADEEGDDADMLDALA